MKEKAVWMIFAVILLAVLGTSYGVYGVTGDDEKITVMNPQGIKPEIRKIPMAPRQASLDGKTVYIVDTKYAMTKPFVTELHKALQEKYPKTNWVLRDKIGVYFDDDPKLWAEIKEKAAGAIVLIGH